MKTRSLRNRLFLLSVTVSVLGYIFGVAVFFTDAARSSLLCGQVVAFLSSNRLLGALCVGPVAVLVVFLFGFSFLGAGGTIAVLYYYAFFTSSFTGLYLRQKGIFGVFSVILKLFPTAVVVIVLLCLIATDSLEYSFTARRKQDREFIYDTFAYIQSSLYLIILSFVSFLWIWKICPFLDGFL